MVVEDDKLLARGLITFLRNAGYAVDHATTAEDALELLKLEHYALIVLDIGLPRMSGFEAVKRLRGGGDRIPVLVLTALDAIEDRVRGLDLGADDYLLKPFDPPELSARVRALLRRSSDAVSTDLVIGGLVCDISAGRASLNGKVLDLRRREWAVLLALASRAGQVVPKERLLSEVFDYDHAVGSNALEVYIARLRQKLANDGPNIRALRGLGYILET